MLKIEIIPYSKKIKKTITSIKELNSLSFQSIVQIIMSSRLQKHYDYLLVDTKVSTYSKVQNIFIQRNTIGLNTESKILRHLKLRNPSTKGCGCKLCIFKHKEYLKRIEYKKLQKELNYLNNLIKKVIKVNNDGSMAITEKRRPFDVNYLTQYKGGLLLKVKNLEHELTRKSITGKTFAPRVLKYNNDIPTLLNNIKKQKQIIEKQLTIISIIISNYYEAREKLSTLLWLPI